MRTFWLYHGNRPVASVRMRANAPDHEVIAAALRQHLQNPTVGLGPYETPLLREGRIRGAEVRRPVDGDGVEARHRRKYNREYRR